MQLGFEAIGMDRDLRCEPVAVVDGFDDPSRRSPCGAEDVVLRKPGRDCRRLLAQGFASIKWPAVTARPWPSTTRRAPRLADAHSAARPVRRVRTGPADPEVAIAETYRDLGRRRAERCRERASHTEHTATAVFGATKPRGNTCCAHLSVDPRPRASVGGRSISATACATDAAVNRSSARRADSSRRWPFHVARADRRRPRHRAVDRVLTHYPAVTTRRDARRQHDLLHSAR